MRQCDMPKCGIYFACIDDEFEVSWFEVRVSEDGDTICVCAKCHEEMEEEQESIKQEALRDYQMHKRIEEAKLDGVWKGA